MSAYDDFCREVVEVVYDEDGNEVLTGEVWNG